MVVMLILFMFMLRFRLGTIIGARLAVVGLRDIPILLLAGVGVGVEITEPASWP